MRRAAIFVEGATEVAFICRLVSEIAGHKNISIEKEQWHARQFLQVEAASLTGDEKYFILVVDCQGESQIKSAILDRRQTLEAAGYEVVLGLRDVFPNFSKADIPRLMAGLAQGIDGVQPPIHICLAVMEVEAWFVQESSHYIKIDPQLTPETIAASGLFDPAIETAEDLKNPAYTLRSIYQLVGKTYSKRQKHVERTVDALDYQEIYLELPAKLPSLKAFVDHVDDFLTAPAASVS